MEMNLNNLQNIASEIIKKVKKINREGASVITLHGDLGAGKTTLTQEIARQFKVKVNIISPTFVIMKKYEVIDKEFKYLIHIDAYRLEKSEELFKLGWQELIENKNNLIIIEWPENVPDCIPKDVLKIEISHINENTRTIKF